MATANVSTRSVLSYQDQDDYLSFEQRGQMPGYQVLSDVNHGLGAQASHR